MLNVRLKFTQKQITQNDTKNSYPTRTEHEKNCSETHR